MRRVGNQYCQVRFENEGQSRCQGNVLGEHYLGILHIFVPLVLMAYGNLEFRILLLCKSHCAFGLSNGIRRGP